jgi:hypothetical protein
MTRPDRARANDEDIEAAVAAAASARAEITVPPMSTPGHGTCAFIYQSGVE